MYRLKSHLPRDRGFLLLALLLAAFGPQVFPAPAKSGELTLKATRTETAPVLDGILDEEIWSKAGESRDFKQKDPKEGDEATEATLIRALYTGKSLFLGIVCSDAESERIVASELRRDGDLTKDDSIWILIDSNHDHRNGFLFASNPLGTQYDALITDEGRDVNVNWDGVWKSVAHRDDRGWTVEIEIPFKTLRIRDTTGRAGLEFRRIIRRKNEFDFWNTWDRNFQFEQVSQAGHLVGLKDLDTGSRWRLKPYVLGGIGQKGARDWENRSAAGIEDLKWRVTPTLTADATYNTDFAEAEIDAQQSTLSNPRNQLFFPEKREFFLEGAGFFDFSAQLDENQKSIFLAFFSRRIGLSPDGQRVPVMGGGKLTGKAGALSIGALSMRTDDEGPIPAATSSVVRARYDLFSRSRIGAIVTDRSAGGLSNRVGGVDGRFIFWNNLGIEGFFLRSATPGIKTEQDAFHGQAYWRTDLWRMGVGHLTLEPNFNPELGFAERLNTRKSIFEFGYRPRPKIRGVRQLEIRPYIEYYTNNRNVVDQKIGHYNFEVLLQNGGKFRYAPHVRFERILSPLRIFPGVTIPVGDYRSTSHVIEYGLDPSRPVSGTLRVSFYTNYFGGDRTSYLLNPQWRPSSSMILDLNWDLTRVGLPQKNFINHIANAGLNYSISTRLLTSTVVQYNNSAQVKALNFRLRYIYRTGDDLFVVFKYVRNGLNPEFSDKAFLVKFTRSFEF